MNDIKQPSGIAHDVAVESEMSHESLSALTAVIQEGIDRALAAKDASLSAREPQTGMCIDCDGSGVYPSGAACKYCGGTGRVGASDGPPAVEPDGMETTAEERRRYSVYLRNDGAFESSLEQRLLRDFDRLLAREAKAREEPLFDILHKLALERGHKPDIAESPFDFLQRLVSRARTAPDLQSEIGLRAHLADLSARGLKP